MADIDNTAFDALISSESAPLTRVTDIDSSFPATNNSFIKVECLTDDGNTVYLSYDDLDVTAVWTYALQIADGIDSQVDALDAVLQSVSTAIAGYTKPYSATEWASIIDALKALPDMHPIMGN